MPMFSLLFQRLISETRQRKSDKLFLTYVNHIVTSTLLA